MTTAESNPSTSVERSHLVLGHQFSFLQMWQNNYLLSTKYYWSLAAMGNKTSRKVTGSRLGAISQCKQKKRLREGIYHWVDLHEQPLKKTLQRPWHTSSFPRQMVSSKDSRHQPRPLSQLVHDDPGWENLPRLAVLAKLPSYHGLSQLKLFPQEGSSLSTELGNQTWTPA